MAKESIILLVETEKTMFFSFARHWREQIFLIHCRLFSDGDEAIHYLLGQGEYASRTPCPLPDLILLDLKLPRMDGFEVLKWIRAQPTLKTLPVLVLTSRSNPRRESGLPTGRQLFPRKTFGFRKPSRVGKGHSTILVRFSTEQPRHQALHVIQAAARTTPGPG